MTRVRMKLYFTIIKHVGVKAAMCTCSIVLTEHCYTTEFTLL